MHSDRQVLFIGHFAVWLTYIRENNQIKLKNHCSFVFNVSSFANTLKVELRLLLIAVFVLWKWILVNISTSIPFSIPLSFPPRPAHAVERSVVWGQRRLRLRPEAGGAVGPQLSALSAVLSDGEGCGEDEPRRLFPHCELRWHMEQKGRSVRKTTSSFIVCSLHFSSSRL